MSKIKPADVLSALRNSGGLCRRVGREDALYKLLRKLGRTGQGRSLAAVVEGMHSSGDLVVLRDGLKFELIALPNAVTDLNEIQRQVASPDEEIPSDEKESEVPAPKGQHHTKQPQMADGSPITSEVMERLNGPVEVRRVASGDDELTVVASLVMESLVRLSKVHVSRQAVLEAAKPVIREVYSTDSTVLVNATAEQVFSWLVDTRKLCRLSKGGRDQQVLYSIQKGSEQRGEGVSAEGAIRALMKRVDELEGELEEAKKCPQGVVSEEELARLLSQLTDRENELKQQTAAHRKALEAQEQVHRRKLAEQTRVHERETVQLRARLEQETKRANELDGKLKSRQTTITDPKLIEELRRRGIKRQGD